ncbi:hypothetical protein [Nocardia transvalensis]|uniref:hypothetical protein n=1 Tax=Nocardia transvalensis TaxID=37333 RepID=UPI001893AC99|nr:hypothetical protein [Nocardia transvalensis]MBF6331473.1 hypothetical protein [Nocardia transvalensis]
MTGSGLLAGPVLAESSSPCGGKPDRYFGTYQGSVTQKIDEEWVQSVAEEIREIKEWDEGGQKNEDDPDTALYGADPWSHLHNTVIKPEMVEQTGGDLSKVRAYLARLYDGKNDMSVRFSYGKKSAGIADYWADVVYNKIEYASGYGVNLTSTPNRVEFNVRTSKTVVIPSGVHKTEVQDPRTAREYETGGYSFTSMESFSLQALDCAGDGVPRRLHAVIKPQFWDAVQATRTVELRREG